MEPIISLKTKSGNLSIAALVTPTGFKPVTA